MTETEWLACRDPEPMLAWLQGRASDRKLRLFACGCGRRVWHLMTDPRSRQAVGVAEADADRPLGGGELDNAWRFGRVAADSAARDFDAAWSAAVAALAATYSPAWNAACDSAERAARADNQPAALADLLRCIVGNPFRAITGGPWVTPAAVTVAQDIYDRRDFSALPLLADLLEEAGCPEQSVLDHCRRPGEHARGCWAVDLVLGKQ
jgi:hypothetical protein